MSKLADFLKQLSTDSTLRDSYISDPDGTMANAGLTQEEIDAVNSGDKDKIRSLASSDGSELGDLTIFIFASDPNA